MPVTTVEGKWTAEAPDGTKIKNTFKGLMVAHEIFIGRNLKKAFVKASLSEIILPDKGYRLIVIEDEMYNP